MATCPSCWEEMRRLRRSPTQRLTSARVYQCDTCNKQVLWYHRRLAAILNRSTWLFALYTTCISCKGTAVRASQSARSSTRNVGVFGAIGQLLASCQYFCARCNVSYFDVRPTEHRLGHQHTHRNHEQTRSRGPRHNRAAELPEVQTQPAPSEPLVVIRIRTRRRAASSASQRERSRAEREEQTPTILASPLTE